MDVSIPVVSQEPILYYSISRRLGTPLISKIKP